MTVAELIEKLKKENQNLHVYIPKLDDDFPEYQLSEEVELEELQDFDDDGGELPCIVIR